MQWNLVTNSIGDFYDLKVPSKCQNKNKYLSVTLVLKQNMVVNVTF